MVWQKGGRKTNQWTKVEIERDMGKVGGSTKADLEFI